MPTTYDIAQGELSANEKGPLVLCKLSIVLWIILIISAVISYLHFLSTEKTYLVFVPFSFLIMILLVKAISGLYYGRIAKFGLIQYFNHGTPFYIRKSKLYAIIVGISSLILIMGMLFYLCMRMI